MPDTGPITIRRERVGLRDAQGRLTGQFGDATRGNVRYVTVQARPGQVVQAVLVVDGKVVGTLGPWVARADDGCMAVAQLRLVVQDRAAPVGGEAS